MRDLAARLFGVERALLDGVCKRATVVAARRAVMTAAAEGGIPEEEIATSFGLKSSRAVREARRWALREEERDRRFAALLHELRRVLPRG
jgi:DNA-binding transcriptional regulator YdaS (Cro superfamily)